MPKIFMIFSFVNVMKIVKYVINILKFNLMHFSFVWIQMCINFSEFRWALPAITAYISLGPSCNHSLYSCNHSLYSFKSEQQINFRWFTAKKYDARGTVYIAENFNFSRGLIQFPSNSPFSWIISQGGAWWHHSVLPVTFLTTPLVITALIAPLTKHKW